MTTEHETDKWAASMARVERVLIESGNPFLVLFFRDAFAALAEKCAKPLGDKPEERIERLMRLGTGKSARAIARRMCDEVLPAASERAQAEMEKEQGQSDGDETTAKR
jgi:hypothetical protein